jgi:cytochrome b561
MTSLSHVSSYSRLLVSLHWTMAVFIVIAFALTFVWEVFPLEARGPWREMHKSLGLVVFVCMVVRIVVRLSGAVPPDANADSPSLRYASRGVHLALYGLMIALTVSGLTMASTFPASSSLRSCSFRSYCRPFRRAAGRCSTRSILWPHIP